MNRWMRKTLVILFTIATFGLVAPPAALTIGEQNSKDTSFRTFEEKHVEIIRETEDTKEDYIADLLINAKEQSYEKFGTKIGEVIDEEFNEVIFPKIEEVITYFVNEQDDEQFKNIAISKNPSGGLGEKIFHIYNRETNEDVLRFHVRRDNPPQQGYSFNFHYHTYHDSFQSHKDLGDIYWDKNMPPKWKTYS
ncbi:YpjP family protein [Metabacillus fastidiosus]|uniref:YpjP family protein n=1 Tax=Metabacillus fastidiosus TaxID=1458 RepID=A0ABU6NW63_9BACI|nr:YpjP family protein [Metabacillus fastidiosus]MED4400622.1 YpjP family protein [Metabacillus fastidiosus]MED4462793.1 YpjP family protein [Metabacillus fastidiosus]